MTVRRRTLLAAVGLGAAAVAGGGWLVLQTGRADPTAALLDRSSAARIGRRILDSDPAAAGAAGERIDAVMQEWPDRAAAVDLRRLVREQVAADFASGRVTDVDGWFLARTEADLAVLAAMVGTEG